MITCRELSEFLMSYLDGELPAGQRAEFERHLRACSGCRCYLDSYERTVRLGKEAMKPDQAPPPAPEELIQAILAARRAGTDNK